MLTREYESGNEGGKLVGTQGFRDNYEIFNATLSVLYQKKPSGVITGLGYQQLPKIIILGSDNKRLNQIQKIIETQFIKEATDPPFKLLKSQVSKEKKQKSQREDQESFRTIFDFNQVILLIDRNFFNHLMHGDLNISEVDYLIFDEAQNIYPESAYVDIMNKFIFNNKLMLSPSKKCDSFQKEQKIPYVLAFFSLESVLQATKYNDEKILQKFQFMANTFNAPLLSLQNQDLTNIDRDIVRKFSQIRVSKIQDILLLSQQAQNYHEFSQKNWKYLSLRRDGLPRVICLRQIIIWKKQLLPYQFFETENAKITQDEAIKINQEWRDKQIEYLKVNQIDTQNIVQKPTLETVQWVENKIRYFSSRIQFDPLLLKICGEDNVKEIATQVFIPFQQEDYGNQLSWLYGDRVFLKKNQSESHVALKQCKILYDMGFLDSNLRPYILKLAEPLNLSGCSSDGESRDENLSKSISDKQQHEQEENKSDSSDKQQQEKEENKSQSITNELTKAYSEYESLNVVSMYWEMNVSVFNSKPYCQSIDLTFERVKQEDGQITYIAYMGTLDFRRFDFSKEQKNKSLNFFQKTRQYLEDAYKYFESQILDQIRKDGQIVPKEHEWLQFNKDYREICQIKQDQPLKNRQSAIKNAAKILYQLSYYAQSNLKKLENQDIPEMRDQIINYLIKGLQTMKVNQRYYLLELESERVRYQKFRELLQRCDIKIINCLSNEINDVGDFIKKLKDTQVQKLYNQLIEYGQALSQEVKQLQEPQLLN